MNLHRMLLARVGWPPEQYAATTLGEARWDDVSSRASDEAVRVRREMERVFAAPREAAVLEH